MTSCLLTDRCSVNKMAVCKFNKASSIKRTPLLFHRMQLLNLLLPLEIAHFGDKHSQSNLTRIACLLTNVDTDVVQLKCSHEMLSHLEILS